MTTRDQLKQLLTPADRFPAPTMPVSSSALHGMKIIFASGAVDAISEPPDNTRRFLVVEVPKRRAQASCPIQLDGPYTARRRALSAKPVASALLCALVAMALKGG